MTGLPAILLRLLLLLHPTHSCCCDAPRPLPSFRTSQVIEEQGQTTGSWRGIKYGDAVESYAPPKGLQLHVLERTVVMDNGILRVTISKPGGFVTGIQYRGGDDVLGGDNVETDRGYLDLVWSKPGTTGTGGTVQKVSARSFKVIAETEEQLELSFTKTWDPSTDLDKLAPLNIDKRFVMLRDSSGFYSYAIYEHLKEWPAFNLPRTRLIFKLRKDKFRYMAISDNRQRYMPMMDDRSPNRSQQLAYPEAVLLVDPVESEFKGEVDDKYQYSCALKDLQVHGWINPDESVGFWQITPSNEFRSGGPLREELSSHVGPANLAIFHSPHNVGEDLVLKFNPGEPWKKVFGPVFTYLNSRFNGSNQLRELWEDAKRQTMVEVNSWPYSFPVSEDFPKSDQRGSVHGRLLVLDRFVNSKNIPANGSLVGLAPPGDPGSWQKNGKGYQFWSKADSEGYFTINHIRAGNYNMFSCIPGFVGEYHNTTVVTISPGRRVDMGDMLFTPPRDGPTLWEIGFPDRSAAEYYVPDPNPKYINKLYVNHSDRYRQYGLWERYTELYPDEDLVYRVGSSKHSKDWFFAQVTRKAGNQSYRGTTWRIRFVLDNVIRSTNYTLRLAIASMHTSDLQVRVNDAGKDPPLFSSGVIGKDNTIARHGIRGTYHLFNVKVPPALLSEGNNTVFLTQPWNAGPFPGVLYDYIRFEAPPRPSLSSPVASSPTILLLQLLFALLTILSSPMASSPTILLLEPSRQSVWKNLRAVKHRIQFGVCEFDIHF